MQTGTVQSVSLQTLRNIRMVPLKYLGNNMNNGKKIRQPDNRIFGGRQVEKVREQLC